MIDRSSQFKRTAPECTMPASYHRTKSRKCTNQDSPRRDQQKKQVSFKDTSTLVITTPKTISELKEAWYSRRALAQFKLDAKRDAQALSQTSTANVINNVAYSIAMGVPRTCTLTTAEKETSNGVEHMISPHVMKILVQRRKKTISNVLDEQDVQRSSGIYDPKRYEIVSRQYSDFATEFRQRLASL
jgi:hypothetical protein